MKYFLFATLFIYVILPVKAQDFFVPDNAFGTVKNKFPTPVQNAKTSDPTPYRIIDGRVYPLENIQTSSEGQSPKTQQVTNRAPLSSKNNTLPNTTNQSVTLSNLPQASVQIQNIKQTDRPQSTPQNVNKPVLQTKLMSDRKLVYQNLFKTYNAEKEQFKKQHKFPKNENLENMLKDFQKPQTITVFQDKL